jgi:hypothetical protein
MQYNEQVLLRWLHLLHDSSCHLYNQGHSLIFKENTYVQRCHVQRCRVQRCQVHHARRHDCANLKEAMRYLFLGSQLPPLTESFNPAATLLI